MTRFSPEAAIKLSQLGMKVNAVRRDQMIAAKPQIKPFTINIHQSALDDLQERLKGTRWPDEAPDSGWTMGTNLAYMKDLVRYWQNQYDWRKHELELNQFHHFITELDGVSIHFIHERGKGPNPTPILLLHGWPD